MSDNLIKEINMNKNSKGLITDPEDMDCLHKIYAEDLPTIRAHKQNANFEYLAGYAEGGGTVPDISINGKTPNENGEITLTPDDVGAAKAGHIHPKATNTSDGFMSSGEHVKLAGVAEEATKNASDEFLLDRKNHTGEQSPSTVIGLLDALAKIPERTSVTGIIRVPNDELVLSINNIRIIARHNPDAIMSITQSIRAKGGTYQVDMIHTSTDGNGVTNPYALDRYALSDEEVLFCINNEVNSFTYNTGYLREGGRLWRFGSFFSQGGTECSLFAERVI